MFLTIFSGISLQKVGIVCFAGCYFIAAVLEFLRLRRPTPIRFTAEVAALCAGLFAHTVFLYFRMKTYDRLPLSSQQDWILVIAWVFAWLAIFLLTSYKEKSFGVIFLPGILALLAWAEWFARDAVGTPQPQSEIWGALHGLAMMLAVVTVLLGVLSGVLYLVQAWHLKHPQRWRLARHLPSLEWLHRANCQAMKFPIFFLACGIFTGMVLNELAAAQGTPKVALRDPFILGTTLLLVWYLASYAVSFFWRFSREGHLVAYRTIISFVALVAVLASGVFLENRHNQGFRVHSSQEVEAPQVPDRGEAP